jgi:hypothetical protein
VSNFIIYALPRSRTKWLSAFLTYGDWLCGHDELRYLRSMDDIASWFAQPCTGTVETAAAPFWRMAKDIKTIVIRRPADEVIQSLIALGLPFDQNALVASIRKLDHKMDQIESRVLGVVSIPYDQLKSEQVCAELFEHCLPYKHDSNRWKMMESMNLQINMGHLVRYYQAHAPQLTKLVKVVKHRTIAAMSREKIAQQDDGLIIHEESLAAVLRDGEKLFAEHVVQVGEAPDGFMDKNYPLMQRLEDLGCLQVMTARCNGRLFGYLMSVMAPSLESPNLMTAIQTTFFASPVFRNLGMKLQRASVAALHDKGIDQIFFHAGVRGAGPRLGTMYRRLGATDFGQMYKLDFSTKYLH